MKTEFIKYFDYIKKILQKVQEAEKINRGSINIADLTNINKLNETLKILNKNSYIQFTVQQGWLNIDYTINEEFKEVLELCDLNNEKLWNEIYYRAQVDTISTILNVL